MRKGIALLMTVALSAALAGCGGSNGGTNEPAGAASDANKGTASETNKGTGNAPAPVDPSSFKEMHLEVLSQLPTNPRKPVEDRLTPIWREKTKVIPDFVEIPANTDYKSWLQMQILANTVPQVIANQNGIADDPANMEMLKKAGMAREITLGELKAYMPLTAERLADLGVTMEQWYKASVDPTDGKLWAIPSLPSPLLKDEYRNSPYGEARLGNGGYGVWFRDDILKKIYPDAMSADELKKLAVANKGKLSLEQIMDIPIHNLDDLHDYLTKVKDLNLTENGHPITPGHLQLENSRGALYWSLFSATGLSLSQSYPLVINESKNLFADYELTPEWKNYISFMNKSFNEGLFGKEFYIQKNEQRDAKIINGEYAVVNMWAPIAANQDKVKKAGGTYNWRYYPIFASELDPGYQDAANQYFPLTTKWNSKVINPKKVTEDRIPQILHWIDWNDSLEAASLREWGTPDMYTGDGMDRRFKPEYKKVEEYKLLGKQDETGDGWYYGIQGQDGTMTNPEVYGLAMAGEMGYVYSPSVVYPFSESNYDQYTLVNQAWQQHNLKRMSLYAELPVDDATQKAKADYDQVSNDVNNTMIAPHNDELDNLIVKAITGPVGKFDANYKAYADVLAGSDIAGGLSKQKDAWMKYYNLRQNFLKKLN
ncbi:hypothetical protein SAMN02799624_03072 [Paenibacillus sp. UNC496MF]|uniref:hypothetical protein n=1 Tax=Paenibacillus sp. UNC496MF TaxID=1502753 RepID=UPI0008EC38DC|nr:hypothetical protein [Paenibacillus sp. UNC496MF]SFJ02809.1 hypothetical protein SAMN02799624_03072 [Paenibacillus sp. UNC496MF]